MSNHILSKSFLLGSICLFSACAWNETMVEPDMESDLRINISGGIQQEYVTRANDEGFCDKDVVGIYVVDFAGSNPGVLQNKGNHADNVRMTFDEAAFKWNTAYDLYWTDKTTKIDIYGYYPYGNPTSVSEYDFEVQMNQNIGAANGQMAAYEASDFLWGKAAGQSPTDRVIKVGFNHQLSNVRVNLQEGTGFVEGEWNSLTKQVLVMNTARKALINLADGQTKADAEIPETGIIPLKSGMDYRAIVVPQTVPAGKELLRVTVGQKNYSLKKDVDMVYVPGKQHNFTLTINKRSETGEFEFILSSESITAWENDAVSHDAVAREYVVIDVKEPGTLLECIQAAGKDPSKVRNLKLTGKINSKDFSVMKYNLSVLRALNMKEVQIVASEGGDQGKPTFYNGNADDAIPEGAMNAKETLTNLILPDRLKSIGAGAFEACINLSGSLIIPEGVVSIDKAAFRDCRNFNGTLVLPSTLKRIGHAGGYISYWDGVFCGCGFVSELNLPSSLEEIGMGSFRDCKNLYGNLIIPENVRLIGESAFFGTKNLKGSLRIPQSISDIPPTCFANSGLNGTLSLHDGIVTIGAGAFNGTGLRGELNLPKNLEVISNETFLGCDFSGNLVLPKGLRVIGDKAFAYNWRLMGIIEIPENVLSIGAGAFAKCRSIEGVIFPEGLESIQYEPEWHEDGGAFQDCFGIGRIVCKGTLPAYVQDGAFHGVAKDNFTLEVPEEAIQQYQTAEGWKNFKRISAYRNLVIRPSVASAINTPVTRDLVLNAEGEWYVESKPDWVTLDKTTGTGKTPLKLTFAELPKGAPARTGKVTFMLKGKDYRTSCTLNQYDYAYAEDEIITLQKATKGKGINIVILGDGYEAKEVSEGKLLKDMNEAMGHYFSIEPYKTYRDYFNVYTAIALSAESGVGSINTIVYNRFNTTAKGGVTLSGRNGESDFVDIMKYACRMPTVSDANLGQTLVIMVPNTVDYGGICYMYPDGFAIAYCPKSNYGYPFDFRGVVQHEAGGHGFGKLGDEYIYHNAFIDNCTCTCCEHVFEFNMAKANGWYDNLSLSGKLNEVPWKHLIFHEKYHLFVDVFEGGFKHSRGVFRSEQNSCMNNDIPYYSTISRESMVKRIMKYAGEPYSFEKFVANDVVDATTPETKANDTVMLNARVVSAHHAPVIMGKRPRIN